MELLIAAMVSVSTGLLVHALHTRDPAVTMRVRDIVGSELSRSASPRVFRPIPWIGERVPFDRDEISKIMHSSGLGSYSPEFLSGARVITAALGVLIGSAMGGVALFAVPVLGLIGYKLPLTLLKRRVAGRRDGILSELPDAVELLAICTRAGLNISLALERVAETSHGVLGEELRNAQGEIELGWSRREALESLATRVSIPRLNDLVRILTTAERFGSRVAVSLESFASDLRNDRRRNAEEQARKAPVKMLFPLVFLILPAFVLLTVVPLLLGTFQSLGF